MEESQMKLVIGLYLQNKAQAGLNSFAKTAENAANKAKAIQEQLNKLRSAAPGAKSASEAQQRILSLAKQEAAVKEKMALSGDASQRRQYRVQLEAYRLVRTQASIRARELTAEEREQRKISVQAAKDQKDLDRATKEWAAEVKRVEKSSAIKSWLEQMRAMLPLMSRAADYQEQILNYTKRQQEIRQQMAASSDQAEQRRLGEESRALQLMLEELRTARSTAAQYERIEETQRRTEAVSRRRTTRELEAAQRESAASRQERADNGWNTASFIAAPIAAGGERMIGDAVRGAADLETAMVTIRNATVNRNANGTYSQTTPAQVEQLRNLAFEISRITAQSVTDSANIMGVMVQAGINDPEKLKALAIPMAKFADVQFLGPHHTSFEESTKEAVQLAHLYGHYSGKPLNDMLNSATKISFMMPDALKQYVTQAGYYMPAFRRLGVSDDQSMVAGAFLDRMGLGRGKGGTGLQNFIMNQMQALALTKHSQQGKKRALEGLGLLNSDGSSKFYKTGADGKAHFDIMGSLAAIDDAIQSRTRGLKGHALELASGKAVTDIQSALGVTGGRVGFLGTPENLAQLHEMMSQYKAMPNTDQAQARYMDTVNGQMQLFKSNFNSLLTEVMWPWMTGLKNTFGFLAEQTHNLQSFLHGDRTLEKLLGLGVIGVVGGAATVTTVAMWRLNVALWRLAGTAGIAGVEGEAVAAVTGLSLLKNAFMMFATGSALAIAVAAGLYGIAKLFEDASFARKGLKQGQSPISVAATAAGSYGREMHNAWLYARHKISYPELVSRNDKINNSGQIDGYDPNFHRTPPGHSGVVHNTTHIKIDAKNDLRGQHSPEKHADMFLKHTARKIAQAAQGSGSVPSLPFMHPSQIGFTAAT